MCATSGSDNQNCLRYRPQIERLAEKPDSPLSAAVARHIEECPACRDLLDRITAVRYVLDRAKWRSMPAGTLALCNRQALKKLEQDQRESVKGQELAAAKPDVPRWQQATIRMGRGGLGVAAGLAIAASNWATTGGLNAAQDKIQALSQVHQQRQIGNWDDPNSDVT